MEYTVSPKGTHKAESLTMKADRYALLPSPFQGTSRYLQCVAGTSPRENVFPFLPPRIHLVNSYSTIKAHLS